MRKFDCMFLLPPELTGESFDTCGALRDVCTHDATCGARIRHTKESRAALAQAIEIQEARREKNAPLTPSAVI